MKQQQQNDLEIFNAALEIAAAEDRAAYLDSVCAGDPALRKKIDSLLVAYEKGSDSLDDLTIKTSRDEAGRIGTDCAPNSVIGRYKLLEKIGEGGFGVVYLAEQNEPVKRRVALKIIKLGMDTRQVVARFEAERQALALMDHPNIAKIYDAGVIESTLTGPSNTLSPTGAEGQGEGAAHLAASAKSHVEDQKSHIHQGGPYFVMELVRGIKITDYCDEKSLSTGERLDLFIQVCQAVQHAHQKGIIHRDLKPSNILVTVNDGQAVPKVIDFGIAKATQAELT